jgi:hypothetical protein
LQETVLFSLSAVDEEVCANDKAVIAGLTGGALFLLTALAAFAKGRRSAVF